MGVMRRPSRSFDREYGSGDWSEASAFSHSSKLTRARSAKPGIEASMQPKRSHIANIVMKTSRVGFSARQTVESKIAAKSFV